MKLLIAVALIAVWLLFPFHLVAQYWRRRRAIREADKYSKSLLK
jgi:Tfp pilus assembly protein FimT